MTVLVTGASGLIGRHTVAALRADGQCVRTFHRGPSLPHPEIQHVVGDICTDLDALRQAAEGCDAVVHLAGRGDVGESRRDPVGYARLNSLGTLHVLEAARASRAHVVVASTQRVYPLTPEPCRETDVLAPDSPYGYAKWTAELWARMASEQFQVPTTVLRFFSVYGPGQAPNGGSGVVTIFARAALAGAPLVVQSGGRRDFTYVRDAARGILLALAQPAACHRVYNIATGIGTSFRALAEAILAAVPGANPSAIREELVEGPGRDLVPSVDLARDELGFRPTISLAEGLAAYVAWLRSHPAE